MAISKKTTPKYNLSEIKSLEVEYGKLEKMQSLIIGDYINSIKKGVSLIDKRSNLINKNIKMAKANGDKTTLASLEKLDKIAVEEYYKQSSLMANLKGADLLMKKYK